MGKYHDQNWIDKIISQGHSLLALGVPLEIVHFPSDGLQGGVDNLPGIASQYSFFLVNLQYISFRDYEAYDITDFPMSDNLYQLVRPHVHIKKSLAEIFEILEKIVQTNDIRLVVVFKFLERGHFKEALLKKLVVNLEYMRTRYYGKVNFIFTTFEPLFIDASSYGITVISKVFRYYDFLTEEDLKETFEYMGYEKEQEINMKKLSEITGNMMVFLKSLLRDCVLNGYEIKSLEKLSFDREFFDRFSNVTSRIQKILKYLPNDQLKALKLIASGHAKKLASNSAAISLLKKFGIVTENLTISSILLHKYLELNSGDIEANTEEEYNYVEIGNIKIEPNSYEILVNGLTTGEYLSEYEFSLIRILLRNKGKVVKREDLAKEVWKDSYLEKYSDWALDKIISRTREKIRDNRPYNIILTLKSRGVMIK